MDQFEKLKTIRLTKANQQKLLDENNGFIAQTNYNSIRGSFHRSYKMMWVSKVHQHLILVP